MCTMENHHQGSGRQACCEAACSPLGRYGSRDWTEKQGQARNLKTHPAATDFLQVSPSDVFPPRDCLWKGWVTPPAVRACVSSCVAGGDAQEPAGNREPHRKVKWKMCEIAELFVRIFLNPCLCKSSLDEKWKPGGGGSL